MPKSKNNIDWDNQPFGKMSDAEVARRVGVTRNAVREQRVKRGIGAFAPRGGSARRSPEIDWDKERGLGVEADVDVARRLNVGVERVRAARRKRGISLPESSLRFQIKGIKWDDEEDLGKIPDRDLAKRLGVTQATVYRARIIRYIPAVMPTATRAKWDDEPLGKMSDKMLSIMLCVSVQSVAAARRKRGIPSYRNTKDRWINN